MAPYIYWFLLALGLVMLELVTGTFYMLVLALALGIGGFAALFGLSEAMQYTLSAIAGVIGILILQYLRRGKAQPAPAQDLDIGQAVQGVSWNKDGSARVMYRGAEWNAEPESADLPHDGPLYIKALRGSTLVLTNRKPEA
jgi:membrane protein implicated in regulation of membrane protease activity